MSMLLYSGLSRAMSLAYVSVANYHELLCMFKLRSFYVSYRKIIMPNYCDNIDILLQLTLRWLPGGQTNASV